MRAAVLCALLGVASAFAQIASQPPHTGQPAPGAAKSDGHRTQHASEPGSQTEHAKSGSSLYSVRSPIGAVEKPGTHKSANHQQQQPANWGAISDWFLVVLTGALAAVTWRLVDETRRLADEAKANSAQQAVATRDAITVARAASDAAVRAVNLQESAEAALLVVERIGLVYTALSEPKPDILGNRVEVTVRNYGRTPAAMRSEIAYYVGGDEPTEIDDAVSRASIYRIISPGQTCTFTCRTIEMTVGQFAGWETGASALFIVGELAYRSAFGGMRIATFCWRYPFRGRGAPQPFTFYANPDNPLNHLRS